MTDELKSAQASYDLARAAVSAAEEELGKAKSAFSAAAEALRSARVKADNALPKVTMVSRSRGGGKDSREEVVIVKRTPKQITVRRPGDTAEWAFRQSRYAYKQWSEYPRSRGFFGTSLVLEDVPEQP